MEFFYLNANRFYIHNLQFAQKLYVVQIQIENKTILQILTKFVCMLQQIFSFAFQLSYQLYTFLSYDVQIVALKIKSC